MSALRLHRKKSQEYLTHPPTISHALDQYYLGKLDAEHFIKNHKAFTRKDVRRKSLVSSGQENPMFPVRITDWKLLASTMFADSGIRLSPLIWKQFFHAWVNRVERSGFRRPRKKEKGKCLLFEYCWECIRDIQHQQHHLDHVWDVEKGLVHDPTLVLITENQTTCRFIAIPVESSPLSEEEEETVENKDNDQQLTEQKSERVGKHEDSLEATGLMEGTASHKTDDPQTTNPNSNPANNEQENERVERNQRVEQEPSVWTTVHGQPFNEVLFTTEDTPFRFWD